MSLPVKYAILELKADGGFAFDYEDITRGFIVSKCYVLEDRLIYSSNYHKYVISFPYDNFEYFMLWFKNNQHKYNGYMNDLYKYYDETSHDPSKEYEREGYPVHIATKLYDDYFIAKEIADHKNGILKGELLTNTGSKAYQRLLGEFDNTMLMCGEYEKFIFANTSDMQIDKDNDLVRRLKP